MCDRSSGLASAGPASFSAAFISALEVVALAHEIQEERRDQHEYVAFVFFLSLKNHHVIVVFQPNVRSHRRSPSCRLVEVPRQNLDCGFMFDDRFRPRQSPGAFQFREALLFIPTGLPIVNQLVAGHEMPEALLKLIFVIGINLAAVMPDWKRAEARPHFDEIPVKDNVKGSYERVPITAKRDVRRQPSWL